METLLKKDAGFIRMGSTLYMRVDEDFYKYIGIESKTDRTNDIKTDAQICLGLGKHGKYLYIFSEKQQRKYQREKAAEHQNQEKL